MIHNIPWQMTPASSNGPQEMPGIRLCEQFRRVGSVPSQPTSFNTMGILSSVNAPLVSAIDPRVMYIVCT